MKFKMILPVFVLLAIITMGAVGAADGDAISDNLTASEDLNMKSSSDIYDEVLGTGEGTFSDLSALIDATPENSILELDKDYKLGADEDRIYIGKTLTIDGKGHTLDGNKGSEIMNIEAYNFTLKNIVFKNGFNENSFGGGIVGDCRDSFNVTNCSFVNCYAASEGGAISLLTNDNFKYNYFIVGCSFVNCTSDWNGGAIYLDRYGNSVIYSTIVNCSFMNCSIADGEGGAIYSEEDIVYCKVSGSDFVNCSAISNGGALKLGGLNTVVDCSFVSCSAGVDGGAIISLGDVANCSFVGCHAKENGGAIIFNSMDNYRDCSVSECSFVNCSASISGGAIYYTYFFDDEIQYLLTVSASAFENCSAGTYGGAIFYEEYDIGHINFCNFTGCSAGSEGGAVYGSDYSEVRVSTSNFENNNAKGSGGAISGGIIFQCEFKNNSKPEISNSKNYGTAIAENATSNDDGIVTLKFPSDAEGSVKFFINGTFVGVAKIVEGIAKIDLSKYKGNYVLTFEYSGDDNYPAFIKNTTVTVYVNPTIINVKNLKVIYSEGKKCTITVYKEEGVIAANVRVVVKVKGKSVKTPNTNAKGGTGFKINQVPGTYKMTITALEKTVTKTLKVKHVVTLKKVAIKQSARKLVLTATLSKINGKYLKNKKVTFKFSGKKYTAKTNKKGVAKLTINSNVLKSLKVGKKVVYQATYLKDTVKKSVKVRR